MSGVKNMPKPEMVRRLDYVRQVMSFVIEELELLAPDIVVPTVAARTKVSIRIANLARVTGGKHAS